MKSFVRSAVCVAIAAGAMVWAGDLPAGRAQDKDKAKPKEKGEKEPTVMQRKLTHAQRILEGLAVNDFAKVGKGADGLIECIKDATWKINDTDKYLLYSNEFLRRSESLKKAAKDKNTDAAALAYVDLTLTCVRCHQHLREERMSALPVPAAPATAVVRK